MRRLKLVGLAVVVSATLSGCLSLGTVSGTGGPTWKPVDASVPAFRRLANPNLDAFSCSGDGQFEFGSFGECDAHYRGVGLVVPIPAACITVLQQFHPFHTAPPPGDPGPIDVAVVEKGTGRVLAEIPDAASWSQFFPAGFQAHKIVARLVVFTTSGAGTITMGNDGSGRVPTVINTPHVAPQGEYIVRVTCATTYNATTGAVERHTDTGVFTPA